jgi:hypothetical protein
MRSIHYTDEDPYKGDYMKKGKKEENKKGIE